MIRLSIADREIAITKDLPARSRDALASNLRQLPAPDIIGADKIGTIAQVWQRPIQKREEVLVWAGMHVRNPLRSLEAFIGDRIPEHAVETLQLRDDLLAARRGSASEDMSCVGTL